MRKMSHRVKKFLRKFYKELYGYIFNPCPHLLIFSPPFCELKICINTQIIKAEFNQSSWFSWIMRLISSVVVAGSIPAFETEKKT